MVVEGKGYRGESMDDVMRVRMRGKGMDEERRVMDEGEME